MIGYANTHRHDETVDVAEFEHLAAKRGRVGGDEIKRHSCHRHEQHADNDNRPVLAEPQQNFSWRGMIRSLASLLEFFSFLQRVTQYEKKRND